jgi:Domain of unknown function (DUF4864)
MRIAVSLVVLFSVMGIARADDLETAQSIIRSQEQAIINDDSATAYSFAGPPITSMYRSAEVFMYMVQKGYAPIYRHKSFELGESKSLEDKISQEVHLIDADGVAWEALYMLERQTDGSWKIVSCVLSKAVGV